MGTFGLGGLHRKSTWLYPVATAAALPPVAVDGSVAVALDTNVGYQYDASLPGWIPFSGGGGGTGHVLCWSVGKSWADVYTELSSLGGCGIILVEQDTVPRSMTAGTFDLTNAAFVGLAQDGSSAVSVEMDDGVRLDTPTLRSKDILWRPLEETGYIYSGPIDSFIELDGGGLVGYTAATAYPIFNLSGPSNVIELRDSAILDATGWSSSTANALITLPAGGSVSFTMTAGAVMGPNILTSSAATSSSVTHDASSAISTTAATGSAALTFTLLDQALYVSYDDSLVSPTLGASTVQDAIDTLKSQTFREVMLTFSAVVPVGTAINIQTGVYAGAGSPATVDYDTNVLFPASGAAFRDDARIEISLNGQELPKGDGTGNGVAEWASATQIKMAIPLKPFGELLIRAPYPTA